MRHREEQPVVLVERGGGVSTFVAGAALGALAALLLAPQSGAETRAQIGARVRRLREAAEDKLDDIQDAVETGYEKTKASIEAGLQRARHNIDERRADAKDAVGAGKAAVRTAREELERRLAEARAQRSQEADE